MKNSVTYSKHQWDVARREQKGLMTVELIRPGKVIGKLGSRVTLQGPIDAAEAERISDFLVEMINRRSPRPTNRPFP